MLQTSVPWQSRLFVVLITRIFLLASRMITLLQFNLVTSCPILNGHGEQIITFFFGAAFQMCKPIFSILHALNRGKPVYLVCLHGLLYAHN